MKTYLQLNRCLSILLSSLVWVPTLASGQTSPIPAQANPGNRPLTDAFVREWTPPPPVFTPESFPVNPPLDIQSPDFTRVELPEIPKLEEIRSARSFGVDFSTPPKGKLTDLELSRLGRLAETYSANGGRLNYDNRSQFDRYLQQHPESPVRASILAEQAHLYRQHGNFLKAEAALREAWTASKDRKDREGRAFAESVLVDLLRNLAKLGRKEPLRELLASVKDRPLGGLAAEAAWRGKETLAFLDSRAEQNIFCGFSAANLVCVPLGQRPIFPDVHDPKEEEQFIREGLSLYELRAHSVEAGGTLAPYKRTSGDAIPVPSVVHWSFGHYSAITEQANGLFRIRDPHLKVNAWVPAEVINEQTSGYFVFPAQTTKPAGFVPVPDGEAKTVFGRHCTHARDDEGCNPSNDCGGGSSAMTTYSLNLLNPGLTLTDTPISY